VDLPGYGYAGVSEKERLSWQKTIEDYLKSRENLTGTIIVMDSRRNWQAEETDLVSWLYHNQIPYVIAMTKIDKLSKNEIQSQKAKLQRDSRCTYVFETSSEKKIGIAELEKFIFNEWIRK
jgi:GTP-binding protein